MRTASIFDYPDCLLAIVNFLSYNLKELREDRKHVLLIAGVIQDVITERSEYEMFGMYSYQSQ